MLYKYPYKIPGMNLDLVIKDTHVQINIVNAFITYYIHRVTLEK